MERFMVDCQNEVCGVMFEKIVESESAGDGSGHTAECPNCHAKTYFEITYVAEVDDCSLQLDED